MYRLNYFPNKYNARTLRTENVFVPVSKMTEKAAYRQRLTLKHFTKYSISRLIKCLL